MLDDCYITAVSYTTGNMCCPLNSQLVVALLGVNFHIATNNSIKQEMTLLGIICYL